MQASISRLCTNNSTQLVSVHRSLHPVYFSGSNRTCDNGRPKLLGLIYTKFSSIRGSETTMSHDYVMCHRVVLQARTPQSDNRAFLELQRHTKNMSNLLAIRYERGQLELLDQRLLPLESIFIPVHTPKDAFDAIRAMVVRGAPAIGCTAALAMAAWLVEQGAGSQFSSAAEASSEIHKQLDYLVERFLPPLPSPGPVQGATCRCTLHALQYTTRMQTGHVSRSIVAH